MLAEQQPMSFETIFEKSKTDRAYENLRTSLVLANILILDNPGTPEAGKLFDSLEAGAETATGAERTRFKNVAGITEADKLANRWAYWSNIDPMTSRRARFALTISENIVNFSFPYSGDQRATLTIRDYPTQGLDVILEIEKGQFLCEAYEECKVRVRFDEDQPEIWKGIGPRDGSHNSIFILNQKRFVQRMRNAKKVLIQPVVYRQGAVMFEFYVGGFDYNLFSTDE